MRTIKLWLAVLLSVVALMTVANRVLPGFATSGQTGAPGTPAGVTATDNIYSTKVGVSWDAVRGATLYRIFRNPANDPGTATAIGTTADSTFFDTTATPTQTLFYWVRAENGNTLSALSAADSGVRA